MKNAAIGLIGVGLVSLVLSFFWPKIAPQAKAPEMDPQLREQLDAIPTDAHAVRRPKEVTEALAAHEEKVAEAEEKAKATAKVGAQVFKYGGLLAALTGVGLFFWAAQNEG